MSRLTLRFHRGTLASLFAVATLFAPAHSLLAQSGADSLKGLPVRFNDPATGTSSHFAAVVMSGDGGFAALVNKLSSGLSKSGIGVVEFNSREWLSPAKTPEQTATVVARVLRAALARYHADSIVLVGYSRGADLAPFVANRLPPDLRAKLGGIAMFGIANTANFEFHLIDLVKDTERDSDIQIMPELLKLKGVPMVCVYGSEEKSSACRDAPSGLMRVEERKGGHHFDGADDTLAPVVLQLLGRHG